MRCISVADWSFLLIPPLFICFLKRGTTDPEDARTFPNLTIENMVGLYSL